MAGGQPNGSVAKSPARSSCPPRASTYRALIPRRRLRRARSEGTRDAHPDGGGNLILAGVGMCILVSS
jgi:hypothetical protein